MKYFTSLLFFAFLTLTVSGQNHFIGVKSGYSWTNIFTDTYAIHKTQQNLTFGFTYDFEIKNKFSLGAEFLYEMRGYTNEFIFTDDLGNPIGEPISMPVNLNYLSLPIKYGYNFGRNFSGYFNLGVCPALLQKSEATYPLFNTDLKYIGDTTVDITNVTKFDFAGLAEIGFGYKISNRFSVFTSFRYQYSFTSMTNEDYYKDYYLNSYAMTLNLGVKYNLTYKSPTGIIPATN